MDQHLGFVGLGNMGLPIARNFAQAGCQLRVYNRTSSKAEPLLELDGVTLVQSPAETVEPGGVVFTMLADDKAVEQVTLGKGGLAARLGPSGLHISMSTIAPTTSTQLAQLESGYLAAPVFGRPDKAASAELIVLSAGNPQARKRARPLLNLVSSALYDLGDDPSTANAVKLAGNFLLMSAMEAMSEAFTFVEKHGAPRKLVAEVLTTTPLMANAYKGYGAAISEGKFSPPGLNLLLGAKDARLVLESADRLGVPMPTANLVRDRFTASINKGRSELDWSALAIEVFEAAGLLSAAPD